MQTEEYRISFFRPTTQQAVKNRNLIIKLFISWAVAIFGFQVLLKVIEKPVPEEALLKFETAWGKIESDGGTVADYQAMAQAMVQVMGKIIIRPDDYTALKDATGWAISMVMHEDDLADLQEYVLYLNVLREEIVSLQDERYMEAKSLIISKAAPALNIGEGTLLAQLLAIGLDDNLSHMAEEHRMKIPGIMSLYLTHNRSVLTDTIFLGFPFHYFYTAVLLLVFFIGLCWIYCYRTDKLHAKLNFIEQID